MSKTKEYLNNLEDQGIDTFGDDNKDLDFEFQEQEELNLKEAYYWWLDKVNREMSMDEDNFENWV